MDLATALVEVECSKAIGIWAELIEGDFTGESEARYGKTNLSYGGVKDCKVFVCDGEYPAWQYMMWTNDGDSNYLDYDDPNFIDHMVEHLNDHKS